MAWTTITVYITSIRSFYHCFYLHIYTQITRLGGALDLQSCRHRQNRRIQYKRIDRVDVSRAQVAAWQDRRDRWKVTVNWQFNTDDARVKLMRVGLRRSLARQ